MSMFLKMTSIEDALAAETWPVDAELIASAMTAAHPGVERRSAPREPMSVVAYAWVLCAGGRSGPTVLYLRDRGPIHVGFLTQDPVPLSYTVDLLIADDAGRHLRRTGTVQRCRECVPGWFEGTIKLNEAWSESTK
jgi:hypothetical protein